MSESPLTRVRSDSDTPPPPSYDQLFPESSSHIRSSSNPAAPEDEEAVLPQRPKRRSRRKTHHDSDRNSSPGLFHRLGRLRDIRVTRPVYFRDRDDHDCGDDNNEERNENAEQSEPASPHASQARGRFFSRGRTEKPPMNPPDYESNEQTEDLRKQEEEQQSQQTASEDIQVFGITEEEVLFNPWAED